MKRIAVFPGSFDPFTIGHESVLRRSLPLFDKVFVMLGLNSTKNSLFKVEDRKTMIETLFVDEPKVEVAVYEGLTVDFCKQVDAGFLLRGLRTSVDFEYERAIAQVNKKMYKEIETVFMLTLPEHTPINSSVVREILRYGGDVSQFVPERLNIQKYF